MTPSPHDFLRHLRVHRPELARRLDGIRSMARSGDELVISVPEGSWSHRELEGLKEGLARAAKDFFGAAAAVRLEARSPEPEALPFPVAATKVWNHVAFWVWDGPRAAVVAVRKTAYAESWLPAGEEAVAGRIETGGEAFVGTYRSPPLPLPRLLEDLCGLARGAMSYAQLVAAFPGDEEADRLEARLYAVKEWGTPAVPAAIFQKYVGRLHYVCPRDPPLGIRIAKRFLAAL